MNYFKVTTALNINIPTYSTINDKNTSNPKSGMGNFGPEWPLSLRVYLQP